MDPAIPVLRGVAGFFCSIRCGGCGRLVKQAAVYGKSGVLEIAILGQSWRNRYSIRIFVLMEQNRNSSIRLHIRNMVCPRCISAVRGIFERAGYHVEAIDLGSVTVSPGPAEAALSRL